MEAFLENHGHTYVDIDKKFPTNLIWFRTVGAPVQLQYLEYELWRNGKFCQVVGNIIPQINDFKTQAKS